MQIIEIEIFRIFVFFFFFPSPTRRGWRKIGDIKKKKKNTEISEYFSKKKDPVTLFEGEGRETEKN